MATGEHRLPALAAPAAIRPATTERGASVLAFGSRGDERPRNLNINHHREDMKEKDTMYLGLIEKLRKEHREDMKEMSAQKDAQLERMLKEMSAQKDAQLERMLKEKDLHLK